MWAWAPMMMLAPAAASSGASASWAWYGQAWPSVPQSGRPGEFHPEAPTERNVTVSSHSALLILSIGMRASMPSARRVPAPLR